LRTGERLPASVVARTLREVRKERHILSAGQQFMDRIKLETRN
jgi:hypothetical protein